MQWKHKGCELHRVLHGSWTTLARTSGGIAGSVHGLHIFSSPSRVVFKFACVYVRAKAWVIAHNRQVWSHASSTTVYEDAQRRKRKQLAINLFEDTPRNKIHRLAPRSAHEQDLVRGRVFKKSCRSIRARQTDAHNKVIEIHWVRTTHLVWRFSLLIATQESKKIGCAPPTCDNYVLMKLGVGHPRETKKENRQKVDLIVVAHSRKKEPT